MDIGLSSLQSIQKILGDFNLIKKHEYTLQHKGEEFILPKIL